MHKSVALSVLVVALAIFVGAPAFAAPGPWYNPTPKVYKKPYTIGFLNNYIGNTWREQFLADAQEGKKYFQKTGDLKDLIVASANNDVTVQLNQFNDMINQGVDAILLNPSSSTALKAAIDRAQAAGILVLIVEAPAPYPEALNIGFDHLLYAKTILNWLIDTIGGKGNIVEIDGVVGNPADQCRTAVWDQILAQHPDVKRLARGPGNWSNTDAQALMSQYLSTYNKIDGLLTQDAMGMGILQAFSNAGVKPFPMMGDNTYGFLRQWQKMGFKGIAFTMHQGIIVENLTFAINILKGMKVDQSKVVGNIFDTSVKNYITMEPPYIITLEGNQNASWMKGLKFTKAISVADAVKKGEGKADNASLEGWMTPEQIAKGWFLK
jgi:ribose transport system substrate-binding protein